MSSTFKVVIQAEPITTLIPEGVTPGPILYTLICNDIEVWRQVSTKFVASFENLAAGFYILTAQRVDLNGVPFGPYHLKGIEVGEELEDSYESLASIEVKAYRHVQPEASVIRRDPPQTAPELVGLLQEIRPKHGVVGSRDVDVTAQQKHIDTAIAAPQAEPAPDDATMLKVISSVLKHHDIVDGVLRADLVAAALQAAQGSIDTAIPTWGERQDAAADAGQFPGFASEHMLAEIADLRAHIAQRAASGDALVYQIANDSKPSGWSDVTKEVFDLHLVTTWRKKRILYAAPAKTLCNKLVGPLIKDTDDAMDLADAAGKRREAAKGAKPKGCKACFGSGGKKNQPCSVCKGTGWEPIEEKAQENAPRTEAIQVATPVPWAKESGKEAQDGASPHADQAQSPVNSIPKAKDQYRKGVIGLQSCTYCCNFPNCMGEVCEHCVDAIPGKHLPETPPR